MSEMLEGNLELIGKSGPLVVGTGGNVGTHLASHGCRTHISEGSGIEGCKGELPTGSVYFKAK